MYKSVNARNPSPGSTTVSSDGICIVASDTVKPELMNGVSWQGRVKAVAARFPALEPGCPHCRNFSTINLVGFFLKSWERTWVLSTVYFYMDKQRNSIFLVIHSLQPAGL